MPVIVLDQSGLPRCQMHICTSAHLHRKPPIHHAVVWNLHKTKMPTLIPPMNFSLPSLDTVVLRRRAWLTRALAIGIGSAVWLNRPPLAHAQLQSINEAINKAGRQRMLSQRMAKAWLAIGLNVEPRKAEKIMADSMALFERQLVELKAFAPSPDILATYRALENVWAEYKSALVGGTPKREAAAALLALDARVLKLAHQGTVQLEQASGKAVGKLVNMAGRERMLSQRSAKFYLCLSWGATDASMDKLRETHIRELNIARDEFVQALDTLSQAPEVNSNIRNELTLARQQWVFFDNALSRLQQTPGSLQHAAEVFTSSEHVLQIMDRVTGMVARLN
jgi:hypothetical protein